VIGVFPQTIAVFRKDLLLEWQGRSRASAVLFFSAMTLLLFSFAVGPNREVLARHAPGYLWLALMLSSVLSLGESFRVETEDDALEGMRLLPVDPRALFFGKAVSNFLLLLGLGLLLVPASLVLYSAEVRGSIPLLLATVALGTAGLAAPGTLYAAMTSRARGRDVLLPLLLFPLVVPVLLASVKATSLAFTGDPMGQGPSWLGVLLCFDVVYWTLPAILFGRVIED
jgi:heme exporter protein B